MDVRQIEKSSDEPLDPPNRSSEYAHGDSQSQTRSNTTKTITVQPWHVVLGPRSGRFMTRATAILREIKVKYESAFRGLAVEFSYESAIQEFCSRIKEEFVALADKDRQEILATVIVDSSAEATERGDTKQASGMSTSEHSSTPSFEIVSGDSAIIAFLLSAHTPSIQEHVVYYRREYDMKRRRGLVNLNLKEFGNYLAFCEDCLAKASNEIMSRDTLEDMNIISNLGEKWRRIKFLEPVFPVLDDSSSGGERGTPIGTSLLPKGRSSKNFFGNAVAASLNQAFLSSCEAGDIRSVEKLFHQGASIYATDHGNESALEKAIKRNHIWLVEFLVGHGASLDKTSDSFDTLMHMAAANGHVEMMAWLKRQGNLSVDALNSEAEKPLHQACKGGHTEAVQWLVRESHDPFTLDIDGNTAVHMAAEQGHLEVLQWLCHYGFDLTAENKMKCTPLDLAVWSGHVDVGDWIVAELDAKLLMKSSNE